MWAEVVGFEAQLQGEVANSAQLTPVEVQSVKPLVCLLKQSYKWAEMFEGLYHLLHPLTICHFQSQLLPETDWC